MTAPGALVLEGVTTVYPRSARILDAILATGLIVITAPVALLVSLAVALDSPGPILYRSARVGRGGRSFLMLKFRTMRHRGAGPAISAHGDPRYTPVGRLIAAARLDELPQLWNVLRGEMRLIGPRPELAEFVVEQAESYRRILTVPPGITGPTQLEFADEGRALAGSADPERFYREQLLPRKVVLDLDYVNGGPSGIDVGILVRTWVVPVRQLSRALADGSGSAGHRARVAAVQAITLTFAILALVATFVAEGSAPL